MPTSYTWNHITLKATGNVLLHLQCEGRTEQRKLGLSVLTSSPAWSARTSTTVRISVLVLPVPEELMVPLLSPIFPQEKEVDGGVKRRLVLGSTGICITTVGVKMWQTLFPPITNLMSLSLALAKSPQEKAVTSLLKIIANLCRKEEEEKKKSPLKDQKLRKWLSDLKSAGVAKRREHVKKCCTQPCTLKFLYPPIAPKTTT